MKKLTLQDITDEDGKLYTNIAIESELMAADWSITEVEATKRAKRSTPKPFKVAAKYFKQDSKV